MVRIGPGGPSADVRQSESRFRSVKIHRILSLVALQGYTMHPVLFARSWQLLQSTETRPAKCPSSLETARDDSGRQTGPKRVLSSAQRTVTAPSRRLPGHAATQGGPVTHQGPCPDPGPGPQTVWRRPSRAVTVRCGVTCVITCRRWYSDQAVTVRCDFGW